jgi:hypothetical protein
MQFLLAWRALLAFALIPALVVLLPAQRPAPANPAITKKVIQDPAEYKAYEAALNTPDAAARGAAMEAFATQYPRSVVLTESLEQAMGAWQAAHNAARVEDAARRLLVLDPGNIRALAIVVAMDRAKVSQGDATVVSEMCLQATGGVRALVLWQKPGGMADADFASLSRQMSAIFTGAMGACALQSKDYSGAREWFTRVFALDPTSLQDVYQLAIADLEMSPVDPGGFWYCGKAIHLAQGAGNSQAADSFAGYCKVQYAHYHGSADGWDAVVAESATQAAPPANLAKQIRSAPAQ